MSTPPVTILVIDDEVAIRESLSGYLEDLGYRIVTAGNGKVGLKLFKKKKPNLVLVDLRMPEMDGLEVLAYVIHDSPQIPIVVVSGAGAIGDVVEALRLGAWDYLMKPIEDLSVLAHSVSKNLERARLIEENRKYLEHLETLVEDKTEQLKKSNRELYRTQSLLKAAIENTPAGILIAEGMEIKVISVNSAALKILGYRGSGTELSQMDLVNLSWNAFAPDGTPLTKDDQPLNLAIKKGRVLKNVQTIIKDRRGKQKWVLANAAPIRDSKGEITGGIVVFPDISEMKEIEEHLRESLEEKNVILKEIHHRVKNNFQLINSLINLQQDFTSDKDYINLLQDIQNRVQSMALVHEGLYQSENLSSISANEILRNLTENLHYIYDSKELPVLMHLDCQELYLDITQAVPFSLLANEIVSNAFKHAFHGKKKGNLWISFQETTMDSKHSYVLSVKDDGKGLPEDYTENLKKRMGFHLIEALISQLEGRLTIHSLANQGAEFIISFFKKS